MNIARQKFNLKQFNGIAVLLEWNSNSLAQTATAYWTPKTDTISRSLTTSGWQTAVAWKARYHKIWLFRVHWSRLWSGITSVRKFASGALVRLCGHCTSPHRCSECLLYHVICCVSRAHAPKNKIDRTTVYMYIVCFCTRRTQYPVLCAPGAHSPLRWWCWNHCNFH